MIDYHYYKMINLYYAYILTQKDISKNITKYAMTQL